MGGRAESIGEWGSIDLLLHEEHVIEKYLATKP